MIKERTMGYNKYSEHTYKVVRLSEAGHEVSSTVATGSRKAFELQRDLEDQGFPVSVFNVTKGVEEYRTGENLEAE
jgi:hypothetical protein